MVNYQSTVAIEICKVACLLIVMMFTIIFTVIPLVLKQFKFNPMIISYCLSLHSGILFSIVFIFFFPTAMDIFIWQVSSIETYRIFPIPFIIALSAYILMLILNKIIYFSREFKIVKNEIIRDFFAKPFNQKIEQSSSKETNYKHTLSVPNQVNLASIKLANIDSYVSYQDRSSEVQQLYISPKKLKNTNSFNNSNFEQEEDKQEEDEYYEIKFKKPKLQFKNNSSQVRKYESQFSSNEDSESNILKQNYTGFAQPYAFAFISCLGGLLEGMALGVQSSLGLLLFFCFTIILHKFTETTMLCVTLIINKVKYIQIVAIMAAYSISEPIGIGIGWIVSDEKIFDAIIISFASGAFLYTIATDGLTDLFEMGGDSKTTKFLHFLIVFLGLILTSLIWCADFELTT